MVTYSSTSRPGQCLCIAERKESFPFTFKLKSRILDLFVYLRKQVTCENGI